MLGIYYLDYSSVLFPKSKRRMIIGYTKSDFLKKLEHMHIPDDYFCWISECRTPGYLFDGRMVDCRAWIIKHMPNNFGQPLK